MRVLDEEWLREWNRELPKLTKRLQDYEEHLKRVHEETGRGRKELSEISTIRSTIRGDPMDPVRWGGLLKRINRVIQPLGMQESHLPSWSLANQQHVRFEMEQQMAR
jgi:hypothetical protein